MAPLAVLADITNAEVGLTGRCTLFSEIGTPAVADLEQHARDCRTFLGGEFADVNRWLDEYFRRMGPSHRRIRHHREGIEQARSLFGDEGALAAKIHVLRDCRHIPEQRDYESGSVDALGLKKDWPASAYVKFSEEDFRELVANEIFGPTGLILWAFINEAAVVQFLANATKYSPQDVQALLPKWSEAVAAKDKLAEPEKALRIRTEVSPQVKEYIDDFLTSPTGLSMRDVHPQLSFVYVPVEQLVTPLVLIDDEYLEHLKPEFQGTEELELAKFALPKTTSFQLRAVADPTARNVTFLSNLKGLTVSPAQIRQLPEGTEVRFLVTASMNLVVVSLIQDRLVLRNGMHRAHLLAKHGVKEIPCLLVREESMPALMTSAYPSFVPSTLLSRRPPLLIDYSNAEVTLEAPMQKTNKIVHIIAEESILPVD